MDASSVPLTIGVVVFPGMTALDALGPFEVLARTPNSTAHLVWKDTEPVVGDTGLAVIPTMTFAQAPQLDVIVVPGGPGQNAHMDDHVLLDFLRRQAPGAQWVTSVCTGSLLLAAAGLLTGYRATCHWMSLDFLRQFPVTVVPERVVVDRNRVTGGGVTSGIDFAFVVLALLRGEPIARLTQLLLEYDPEPPFRSGHPKVASADMVAAARALAGPMLQKREAAARAAAVRLAATPGPS